MSLLHISISLLQWVVILRERSDSISPVVIEFRAIPKFTLKVLKSCSNEQDTTT